MTALVNGLLWFGIFAIPMLIAVMLRRLARKYYAPADPAQEPTTEGGSGGGYSRTVNDRVRAALELLPA